MSHPQPPFRPKAHGATHVGKRRDQNQDAVWVDDLGRAAVVCDGVGGHPKGGEASHRAIRAAGEVLEQPSDHPARQVREAIRQAGEAVLAIESPGLATEKQACLISLLLVRSLPNWWAEPWAHKSNSPPPFLAC